MVTYNKFQGFVGYLGLAAINLNTDQIKVALSNTLPLATNDVWADITEFSGGTGYTTKGADVLNTYSETTGTGTVAVTDVTWNAGASDWGPFQYVVAFDEDVASPVVDPLIAWWDHGSALTLVSGESFTVDFENDALLTIAQAA